jgi:alpha-beta hydrolase superfamily lysophospholipase
MVMGSPSRAEEIADLAIVSLRVPKSVRLADKHRLRTVRVAVKLQNRGTGDLLIPNLETLGAAIQIVPERVDGAIFCPEIQITPRPLRVSLPIRLPARGKLRALFDVVFTCGSNPEENVSDWQFTARVDHALLDGRRDANPADDVCPRDPLGPIIRPDGKMRDRGCGVRGQDGVRMAPAVNVKDLRTSTRLLRSGPFDVGVTGLTLVDESRPTMPNGDFPGLPDRTLPTRVWYPAAPGRGGTDADLAPDRAPYPLILFSHGLGSPNDASIYLVTHLASHGYIVVAPAYPLSTSGAPGGQTMADTPAEAGDVGFVIDRFLGFSDEPGNRFENAVDGDRIGLTGHSAGGLTTVVATYDQNLRDPRIKAAAPIAGPGCFFQPGYFGAVDVPLLILHGDADLFVDLVNHAQALLANANAPKSLVTVQGGNHIGFSDAGTIIDDLFGCAFLPDPNSLGVQTTELVAGLGGDPTGFLRVDPTGRRGGRALPRGGRRSPEPGSHPRGSSLGAHQPGDP